MLKDAIKTVASYTPSKAELGVRRWHEEKQEKKGSSPKCVSSDTSRLRVSESNCLSGAEAHHHRCTASQLHGLTVLASTSVALTAPLG